MKKNFRVLKKPAVCILISILIFLYVVITVSARTYDLSYLTKIRVQEEGKYELTNENRCAAFQTHAGAINVNLTNSEGYEMEYEIFNKSSKLDYENALTKCMSTIFLEVTYLPENKKLICETILDLNEINAINDACDANNDADLKQIMFTKCLIVFKNAGYTTPKLEDFGINDSQKGQICNRNTSLTSTFSPSEHFYALIVKLPRTNSPEEINLILNYDLPKENQELFEIFLNRITWNLVSNEEELELIFPENSFLWSSSDFPINISEKKNKIHAIWDKQKMKNNLLEITFGTKSEYFYYDGIKENMSNLFIAALFFLIPITLVLFYPQEKLSYLKFRTLAIHTLIVTFLLMFAFFIIPFFLSDNFIKPFLFRYFGSLLIKAVAIGIAVLVVLYLLFKLRRISR